MNARSQFAADYRTARTLYSATIAADRSGDKAALSAADAAWYSFAESRTYTPPGARHGWTPAAWARIKGWRQPTRMALSNCAIQAWRARLPTYDRDYQGEVRAFLRGVRPTVPGSFTLERLPLP